PGHCDPADPGVRRNQHYADIAASIQKVTEEVVLKMVGHLHETTGMKRLCMAGGVALNSVANGRIMRESPFEEVFIQPAAGDAGGALGAALYVHHVLLGHPRRFVMEHAYWGREYGEQDIRSSIERTGLPAVRIDDEEKLTDRIVEELLSGKVMGLFQGRFEWGPRALGNRSIIADPRDPGMKDTINRKIKFREPFRPFAPVVTESDAGTYFDGIEGLAGAWPLRYMLSVFPWRQDKAGVAPAVNHLGTGRLQTVRPEWNSRYCRVVDKFGQATGTRVLVNTSYNLRGEPIVSSPGDALRTFANSGIDHAVLDHWLVSKPG
ncbi:nodulation protein, partial [Candidatus Fermentibacterales bacterium]|nr:nodulation protein [Candidatus Fermentibacterales bacterium]